MRLDYARLEALRARHRGWDLLSSPMAPLAASVLHAAFIAAKRSGVAEEDLLEVLEDELYRLRQRHGDAALATPAADYLAQWSAAPCGWLHKFYGPESDEPQYRLAFGAAQAIGWLAALSEGHASGTATRLSLLRDVLQHTVEHGASARATPADALRHSANAVDAQLSDYDVQGALPMDAVVLTERLHEIARMSEDLLFAMRGAEEELLQSAQRVRTALATESLDPAPSADALSRMRGEMAHSAPGASVLAAWDALVSVDGGCAMRERLDALASLAIAAAGGLDERLRAAYDDWLEAAARARRTLARLSSRLQRYAEAKPWLDQAQIAPIVARIEAAGVLADSMLSEPASRVPTAEGEPEARAKIGIPTIEPDGSDEVLAASATLRARWTETAGSRIDRNALVGRIEALLQSGGEISLLELTRRHPLRRGLDELLGYCELAEERFSPSAGGNETEVIEWQVMKADGASVRRQAELPRLVFAR